MPIESGNPETEPMGGALQPKPPEILQKLKWLRLYGRQYLSLIIFALIVLALGWIIPAFGDKIIAILFSPDPSFDWGNLFETPLKWEYGDRLR